MRRQRRQAEEHEERMLALNRRVRDDLPLTSAEHAAWKEWTCRSLSSAGKRRKRKKRRKKKLPRCALPRHGCRRPCVHQRQVPAVCTPVVTQRQVPTVHSFILPVQLLDKVLDVPVVVLRQVPGLMVQKTVVVPQLPSIESRRLPFRAAEARRSFASRSTGNLVEQRDDATMFPKTALSLVCGTFMRQSTGFVEFQVFLREKVAYGS